MNRVIPPSAIWRTSRSFSRKSIDRHASLRRASGGTGNTPRRSAGTRGAVLMGTLLPAHVPVEHVLNFFFSDRADNRISYGAILEKQQRRDASDLEAASRVRVVIHVELADLGLPDVLGGDGIDGRSHHLTGAAPLRPEVHENRHLGPQDVDIERCICEVVNVVSSHAVSFLASKYYNAWKPARGPAAAQGAAP